MWRSDRATRPASGPGTRRLALGRIVLASVAPALLLAGCASPVAPPVSDGQRPSAWSGRFAVTWVESPDSLREESASGRFLLRELGASTELEVYSPFGQTVARAIAGPAGAVLETSDGTRYEAASPEALTERVLGWRVPVGRLPAWLRGPEQAPGAPSRWIDADWSVSVDDTVDRRPSRLTLKWPVTALPGGWRRVTIRLVLDGAQPLAATER